MGIIPVLSYDRENQEEAYQRSRSYTARPMWRPRCTGFIGSSLSKYGIRPVCLYHERRYLCGFWRWILKPGRCRWD